MKTVCCRLYPVCYCQELPRDPVHDRRIEILRSSTPGEQLDLYFEQQSRRRAQRQRNAIVCAAAFVLATIVLVLTLAGCGPDDGVIGPSSPAPQPTTSEMFTVIKPGNHLGGSYGNAHNNN